ncbi:MAG: 16S rRNA (adenine(1518)-N(6)/adenine(1519)-N(6))-dimethyltransferase RsmA [Deltaproteobacteria bacterium]|nr:16S rRNA (adenine(1518)-N(6)/adenine(1519)-N(6))-dimethyltransferase RsmA [Deltaproteobacteria bacterium]
MPSPRQTLKDLGLAPSRYRGQNFLKDPNTARNLAKLIMDQGQENILEIGPGLGALTRPLLDLGANIWAVELDRGLAESLNGWPESRTGRLKVFQKDILETDLEETGPGPRTVAGNVPYNISTPILFWFLGQIPKAQSGVFTLQKEMALRLTAQAGQEHYGRLAVAMNLWLETRLVLDIPAASFQPRPKVQSAAVALKPKTPPDISLAALGRLTAASFHSRRKTLFNNLGPVYGPEKTRAALAALAIDPGIRAERLSPEIFAELAKILDNEPGGA